MANQVLTAAPPEFRRLKQAERRRVYIFLGGRGLVNN